MKPQRISTLEGIFVLDDSGFYKPYTEPAPKSSGLWLYAMAMAGFIIFAGIGAWVLAGIEQPAQVAATDVAVE